MNIMRGDTVNISAMGVTRTLVVTSVSSSHRGGYDNWHIEGNDEVHGAVNWKQIPDGGIINWHKPLPRWVVVGALYDDENDAYFSHTIAAPDKDTAVETVLRAVNPAGLCPHQIYQVHGPFADLESAR